MTRRAAPAPPRPPPDRVEVKAYVTRAEREMIVAATRAADDRSVSAWARRMLLAAARRGPV